MLTLRQLRYFIALGETGHFGRAAALAAVSQPALSMQINELEAALGVALVERRNRGSVLTPVGRDIYERAKDIIAAVRDLEDQAVHGDRLLTGLMRLGAIPSIAPYLLPAVLPRLEHDYPDLSIDLRETVTETLLADLTHGFLDVVLIALPAAGLDIKTDIKTEALFDDPLLLAVPESEPDVPEPVSTGWVSDRRLLLLEEGHCLREQALDFCNMDHPGVRSALGVSSLATVMQLVARGLGVTLLPEMAREREASSGMSVRLLSFAPPVPRRTIGLAWRTSSPRQKDFLALGEAIKRSVGSGNTYR